ncbi:MAG TPA: phosphoheptose isomerase, partial [Alphaproteobacteria bacterium]|nr:phosphoheptose isomerase [Alphaproteobacteria bacterium]
MSNQTGLQTLYPFLHGARQDPAKMRLSLLDSVRAKAEESRQANADFFSGNGEALVAAAEALAAVWRRGGRLFAMGNGGSSCDA